MVIDVLEDKKRVEIWIANNEQDDKTEFTLSKTVKQYSEMKYFVVIFRSGGGDLFKNTEALILRNRAS